MTQRCWWIGITLIATPPVWSAEGEKPDERAKEAVARFMTAFKASDLEGIMQVADVPWFHDGKSVLRRRDEVRQEFKKLFARSKDLANLSYEIRQIATYKAVREKLKPEEQQLLDQVLNEDDRVALIAIDRGTEQLEKVALAVRVRNGEAKIVGIRN